jgi:hypothetical protein
VTAKRPSLKAIEGHATTTSAPATTPAARGAGTMDKGDVDAEIAEMLKGGKVSYSYWQSYTWKNELAEQKRRILQLLAEVIFDTETEHNPHHMLERAIGVAAVCMRRLIECRLVTDRFRDSKLTVHNIRVKADIEWREPFISETGGMFFNNYDMKARHPEQKPPKMISDRMLHARVIAVLSGSAYLPDGLLIASDNQHRTELFHFTSEEIAAVFDAFLDDRVVFAADGYLDDNETVVAIREGESDRRTSIRVPAPGNGT